MIKMMLIMQFLLCLEEFRVMYDELTLVEWTCFII